ncbi:hypothetical protein MTR_2g461600 [Medicago truncatula]|uniref:Uncharacterized protein n=1 Tax=Medicago truncatula TaxID=3880 RepID=A0A072V9P4_MEDTR|nr:hypothetical protein MTR_2g461600 [Medicago truncatula]
MHYLYCFSHKTASKHGSPKQVLFTTVDTIHHALFIVVDSVHHGTVHGSKLLNVILFIVTGTDTDLGKTIGNAREWNGLYCFDNQNLLISSNISNNKYFFSESIQTNKEQVFLYHCLLGHPCEGRKGLAHEAAPQV